MTNEPKASEEAYKNNKSKRTVTVLFCPDKKSCNPDGLGESERLELFCPRVVFDFPPSCGEPLGVMTTAHDFLPITTDMQLLPVFTWEMFDTIARDVNDVIDVAIVNKAQNEKMKKLLSAAIYEAYQNRLQLLQQGRRYCGRDLLNAQSHNATFEF